MYTLCGVNTCYNNNNNIRESGRVNAVLYKGGVNAGQVGKGLMLGMWGRVIDLAEAWSQ